MHNFNEEYEIIRTLASSDMSTEEGMEKLIDHCKRKYPNDLWNKFLTIDYAADTDKIAFWLSEALQSKAWPGNIEALWFAICNPSYAETFDLRMTGSECFITDSDGFYEDIIFSESFIPREQYARSASLRVIHRYTADASPFSETAEYVLALGFAALAVSEVCRRTEITSLPAAQSVIHIAAGFETGDMMLLTCLEHSS